MLSACTLVLLRGVGVVGLKGGCVGCVGGVTVVSHPDEREKNENSWESRTGLDPSYNKIVVPGTDARGTIAMLS